MKRNYPKCSLWVLPQTELHYSNLKKPVCIFLLHMIHNEMRYIHLVLQNIFFLTSERSQN
jgi:hypothetical protein